MNKQRRSNRVRSVLLVYIDKEINAYLSQSNIKINHMLSKDFIKQFESQCKISFDNSIVRGIDYIPSFHSNKSKEINLSNSHSLSVIYFHKCVQEMGKSFIDERKIDLGSRKLGFKQALGIQISEDKSFKVKLKSSQSMIRYRKSKFAILSKKEQKEKLIEDNLNQLNIIVKALKIIANDDKDFYVCYNKETYANGVSPFQCNLPIIHNQYLNSNNDLKEETSNISNDCVDWITPFKQCDGNRSNTNNNCTNNNNKTFSENCVYQTETEACRSIITITPSHASHTNDRNKTNNVSSFCFETESAK